MTTLYDTDFYEWTQRQAAALRARQFDALDIEALAEEVEDLAKNQTRAIKSQLERVMLHLLKWCYQPWRRTDSWMDSINDGRTQIAGHMEDSPSLRLYPHTQIEACYTKARRAAARQTGLDIQTFPEACPWTAEQILDDDFWPETEAQS